MDSRKRSLTKSITWRVIGVVILGGITYLFTGNFWESVGVTSVFNALRFVLYYWHERIWEGIRWGKKLHPLAVHPVRTDLSTEDHRVIRKFLVEQNYADGTEDYQI